MDTTIQPVQSKPKLLDQLPHVSNKGGHGVRSPVDGL